MAVAALAIISANTTVREDLAKRGTMQVLHNHALQYADRRVLLQLFASMMNANDDPLLQRSALAGAAAYPQLLFNCESMLLFRLLCAGL